MGRSRGTRSVINELSKLPEWAHALLPTLRTVPIAVRATTVRALRYLACYLEQEWAIHAAQQTLPQVKTEDDDAVARAPWKRRRTRSRSPSPASRASSVV